MDNKDHDLLTRIDANLDNFLNKFNEHVEEDKLLRKDVALHSKIIYGILGAIGFIEFISRFTGKF